MHRVRHFQCWQGFTIKSIIGKGSHFIYLSELSYRTDLNFSNWNALAAYLLSFRHLNWFLYGLMQKVFDILISQKMLNYSLLKCHWHLLYIRLLIFSPRPRIGGIFTVITKFWTIVSINCWPDLNSCYAHWWHYFILK